MAEVPCLVKQDMLALSGVFAEGPDGDGGGEEPLECA